MWAVAEEPSGIDPVVAIYWRALPQVYGYLLVRCRDASVAEDLTAETFLAAAAATRAERVPDLTVAWLIGVARHKLVDHWRRTAREQPKLALASQAERRPRRPLGGAGRHPVRSRRFVPLCFRPTNAPPSLALCGRVVSGRGRRARRPAACSCHRDAPGPRASSLAPHFDEEGEGHDD